MMMRITDSTIEDEEGIEEDEDEDWDEQEEEDEDFLQDHHGGGGVHPDDDEGEMNDHRPTIQGRPIQRATDRLVHDEDSIIGNILDQLQHQTHWAADQALHSTQLTTSGGGFRIRLRIQSTNANTSTNQCHHMTTTPVHLPQVHALS